MHLRITKYDPQFRDEYGCYHKEEWTAISDIGRVYNGQIVTASQYFEVEDSYCAAIKLLLQYLKIPTFKIFRCSSRRIIPSFFTNTKFFYVRDEFNESLVSGKVCQWNDIEIIIRSSLREDFDCMFKGKKNTYLYFGYDYYMFFGSSIDIDLSTVPFPKNIFVENCNPPDINLKRHSSCSIRLVPQPANWGNKLRKTLFFYLTKPPSLPNLRLWNKSIL